jgi:phosphoribosylaminoimidazole-succinocarboxamide synthase
MTSAPVFLGRDVRVPGYELVASGKVRDVYAIDARHLLFVTTDRVSAFDVVMREGIPWKGSVLTAISAWWFEHTRDVIENHLVSTSVDELRGLDAGWRERLRGRIMIVRRAQPTTVEWVVRGYLAGSGWKEYQSSRSVCGIPLPAGLENASRLPKPILTPTTKDKDHDLPLSPAEARERVGASVFERAERAALELFAHGTRELERVDILLADTKFEFGELDGRLILIDEALTPDSSRFWPKASWKPGTNPPSLDKQILRDWLETQPWNKNPPPPALPPELVERVSRRYLEICEKITGRSPLSSAGAPAGVRA